MPPRFGSHGAAAVMMRRCWRIVGQLLLLLLLMNMNVVHVRAQSDYDNYGYNNDNDYSDPNQRGQPPPPDSLYHDYAVRQQEKEIGAVGGYVHTSECALLCAKKDCNCARTVVVVCKHDNVLPSSSGMREHRVQQHYHS
jgi:hypothetical protein